MPKTKEERTERRARQQQLRKSRNSQGCDKLIGIYETHIVPRMNDIDGERRKELIKHSLELVKTLETVLRCSDASIKETRLQELSDLLRERYYKNKEEEMEGVKRSITPRPPFTVILEMGQRTLQGNEQNLQQWLQTVYRESRLQNNKENPLSARVFCRVYRQAGSERKYWGANVGAFRFNKPLVNQYVENLKQAHFHKDVNDALNSVQNDTITQTVDLPERVGCSAFKYGDGNNVFKNFKTVAPCKRCKLMYPGVIFDPDHPSTFRYDKLYPWGRCAEHYAVSKFLHDTD
ncbi:uncharacterized protein [Ptychodera flava]|uniref:uncharacterized protein n=1 Tax=Ptychodera flava TaxID=63121 RepID=UPI00396A7104